MSIVFRSLFLEYLPDAPGSGGARCLLSGSRLLGGLAFEYGVSRKQASGLEYFLRIILSQYHGTDLLDMSSSQILEWSVFF